MTNLESLGNTAGPARVATPENEAKLAEIAAATGFASQSHLTNLFRARFGITPGRVRTRDGQRLLAG